MANEQELKMKSIEDEDIRAEINAFVQTIIIEYQSRHRITILSHEMEPKSMIENGCHTSSSIFRLQLAFESNGKQCGSSIIVKVPQLSPSYAYLQKLGMYRMEVYMYETVLSRIYQFWSSQRMTPFFYGASPGGSLALENLHEHGFRTPQKNSLLDLSECEVVLKKLAQFHATSVKYFQLYGTEEFDEAMPSLPSELADSFEGPFGKIRRYVVPTLSESALKKWTHFERNRKTVRHNVYSMSRKVGGFNVILHGDLNFNNLLFKDDECRLVDFQLSRRGSPSLDLVYFFVTSVKWEVFERHRGDIFNYYLGVLNNVLKELDCKARYSLDELNADFEKCELYSILILCTVTPFLWSGTGDLETLWAKEANELDNIMQSVEFITLFKNWMEVV